MPTFKILIIGGGLGGLAASIALGQIGHHVTVLESTPKLTTIGGGISIPPNSMRVMDHLGILQRVKDAAEVSASAKTYFRRYNGDLICDAGQRAKLYKYDHFNIHRAPFQRVLAEAAAEAGVKILVNARVVSIDDSGKSPIAITKDGRIFEADLIIGADGAKSTVRGMVYPEIQLESSWNCYRAVIDGKVFKENSDIEHLMNEANLWWGENRIIVGVPVQNKTAYSLELAHPGNTGTAGDWSKKGDVNEMKVKYSDFESAIVKLMEHVKPENLLVWKLVQLPQLDSWSMKSGRVLLIADAAHAMTPYTGQGHAMAMEDSAALGECLARAKDVKDIPQAVRAFEAIRKPRTKIMSDFGAMNAHMWQLPDGEEQRQRDERIKNRPIFSAGGWDGKHIDKVPETPGDPLFFAWMLGHDVVDFTNRRLDEIWA